MQNAYIANINKTKGNIMSEEDPDIKKLLLKWKKDKNIQQLKQFYETKSFSEILGIERREVSHSNFIAWMLNDKESHGLSDFGIKKLLDILIEYGEYKIEKAVNLYKEKKDDKKWDDLYKTLMLGSYDIINLEIETEKAITDKKRIDIVISMEIKSEKKDVELPKKINIIIENKVDSKVHDNQTENYFKHYEENNKKECNIFVFLLPVEISKLREDFAGEEHYININYQLLADNIFEKALEQDLSKRIKFIIEEYLLSLRTQNKGEVMAIGNLEKELLKDFWEEHQEFLSSAFKVLAEEETDEELKNNFQEMATINEKARDKTKYNFNGKNKLAKGKLVFEVIKKYVEKNEKATLDNLQNQFQKKMKSFLTIEKDFKEKYEGNPDIRHSKEPIIVNEEKIYISTQWVKESIDEFIKNVKELNLGSDFDIKEV